MKEKQQKKNDELQDIPYMSNIMMVLFLFVSDLKKQLQKHKYKKN
jgi:hypothetical protein